MATMIEQQVTLDEALVPSTKWLRIRRSNFRLPSDIQSKESTLQVVYDVLRRSPFFKAFLVTADVPTCRNSGQQIMFINTPSDSKWIPERTLSIWKHLGRCCISVLGFRLSQAQILWALYHKRNIDYAFLIWEDFVYQVEHKNQKKSNEMYYPRFTKVIIHHFMTKKPSIPRRNMVNWHYVRDDILFSTIKVVSRHQNTQQYGAILPIELTNEDIRNTKAYKEYYACSTGEAAPKPKARARWKRSDEGTGSKPRVSDVPSDDSKDEISWNSSDDENVDAQDKDKNDDEGDKKDESDDGKEDDDDDNKDGAERDDDDDDDDDDEEVIAKIDEPEDTESGGGDDKETKSDEESDEEETREEEEESFDQIPRTPEESEDDGNGEEDQGLRVSEEQRLIEEEEADELYRDVDINQGRGLKLSQDIEDSHVTLTLVNPDGQQKSLSVSLHFVSSMLNPISDAGMESIFATASSPIAPLQKPTPIMTPLTIATITTIMMHQFLQHQFQVKQTNPFTEDVSNILGIVQQYMNQQMNKAVRVAVQIQTDRLRDSYQIENDEFLRIINDNIKRIIKEQVKSQVKDQVSRILPRIEQSVNAQLESEVLTRLSHSSWTSYAVAADLSKMELKKILIQKMEGNQSIQCFDEQMNLYKDLVEAYEADKIILDTFGERVILKRRRDDDDDQGEGPSAGSDWGSKRQREGNEPESARAPLEPATRSVGRSTTGSKSRQASASESAFAEEPVQTTSHIEEPSYPVLETGAEDQPIVQTSQHSQCLTDLEYHLEEVYKATKDQLDWVNPEEPINYDKHALWGVSHWGRKRQQFYGFAVNQEFALDVYSKRRIIAVTDLKIMEWHNYRHLDWISVRKLSNLTVEERYAFNVSLRMFTRSIVIQRRVEDLQLGVKIYKKRLNLTKPNTYRSDLKRREAYTAYSNPRGFIYQNKDKKNRLMRIDELYQFSDETVNDVCNALDNRLKGIRMQYLPQTI
nr:hypothetical protein [Tanacetum cinerariifolium]